MSRFDQLRSNGALRIVSASERNSAILIEEQQPANYTSSELEVESNSTFAIRRVGSNRVSTSTRIIQYCFLTLLVAISLYLLICLMN